jgi:hypothetical protein
MTIVQWLRGSGLLVEDYASAGVEEADALLNIAAGEHCARFAVESKGRAPYPQEIERLHLKWQDLASLGHPLLTAPFVSESLGPLLTGAGWSWADDQGNFDLRAPGLLLRQRRTTVPPPSNQETLPGGSGSFAIIRALVKGRAATEEWGTTALADMAGVSQPRASQVLRRLHDLGLVEQTRRGRWKPQSAALIDRFLAEYPGPRGSESYYYGLDSLVEVTIRAGLAGGPDRQIVASADVGPDLIAPWRRPSQVILYTNHVLSPSTLGLVDARGRHDANVIVRMPDDQSVFPRPPLVAQVQGQDVPMADPLQQIWDLENLGGADRTEAAGRLREWLLAAP